MAESCSANMEVRSPQPSFSTCKGQSRNYKKFYIDVYTKEENLQPQSPQAPKAMPDLVPLPDEAPVHPKKRLKRECDDPMLGEAAASPMSSINPYSPVSVLTKFGEGDDKILKAPATAADARIFLNSDLLGSLPNSPYTNVASPLDLTGFSDAAFGPLLYPFSPDSLSQESFAQDLYTSKTAVSSNLPPQEILSPRSPQKERLEPHPKPGFRPQSAALDLTSLQNFHAENPLYLHPPPPQYRHHQVNSNLPLPSCSVTPLHSDGQTQNSEPKKGFQIVGRRSGILSQAGQPRLIQQTFDRPTGIVPPIVQNHPLYSQSGHANLTHSYPAKHMSIPRQSAGFVGGVGGGAVGVIRPKPHFYRRPIPHSLVCHPVPKELPLLHSPTGTQSKRVPSEMINYGNSGFTRDMPNITLQPPTAAKKQLSWLQDDDDGPNSHPSCRPHDDRAQGDIVSYTQKPIATWSYTDIIYFMFDASRDLKIRDQDLIISRLSGLTGKDLLNMQVEDFRRFMRRAETGDMLHRYFINKVQEERRQAAVAAQQNPANRLSLDTSQYEFNNPFFQPSHHSPIHLQQRQQLPSSLMLRDLSSGGIDTSAPYEVRYETVDTRAISNYDETRKLLSGAPPSALGKSFDLLHAPSPAMHFEMDDHLSDPEMDSIEYDEHILGLADQSCNEEEVKPEPPKKRGPGRPRKPENELKKKKKKTGRLWEFIRNLLLDPETCPSLVKWENAEEGIFRFIQAEKVAQRWGERKQNKEMNYEKLSRAMRYYYKGGVFEAVIGRRLVYKFGKNAKNWRPSNPNFTNHVPYSQASSH